MSNVNDSARECNKKIAAVCRTDKVSARKHFGSRRRYRKRFEFDPTRRCEIERHALHVGAADSDDFDRWLIAWVWHNRKSTDPVWALMNAAVRMGGRLSEADTREILDRAASVRKRMSADRLARWLELTFEVRTALRITTIGSVDVPKRARKEIRRRKDRAYQERKRRARGVRPQFESLSATQPWRELGMSKRTWYRRNKERNGTSGTTSSAAIFYVSDDETVPRTTKVSTASPSAREFESLAGHLRMAALGR